MRQLQNTGLHILTCHEYHRVQVTKTMLSGGQKGTRAESAGHENWDLDVAIRGASSSPVRRHAAEIGLLKCSCTPVSRQQRGGCDAMVVYAAQRTQAALPLPIPSLTLLASSSCLAAKNKTTHKNAA